MKNIVNEAGDQLKTLAQDQPPMTEARVNWWKLEIFQQVYGPELFNKKFEEKKTHK